MSDVWWNARVDLIEVTKNGRERVIERIEGNDCDKHTDAHDLYTQLAEMVRDSYNDDD